jgi:tRNA (guanine-N7-)-methyltransferase
MKPLRYSSLKPFINHFALTLPVDWSAIFNRRAPLEVEIGFGTGEYLVRLASQSPQHDFIGIEENVERIHKTLRKIELAGLTNVRLMRIDARLAFERLFLSKTITRIHCLFPCPWPNKNQVKHRLFSKAFIKLLNDRLIPTGTADLVTDHAKFASWVRRQAPETGFKVTSQTIAPRFDTKFERKWREAGQEKFFAIHFLKTQHLKNALKREVELKVYFFDEFEPDHFKFKDLKGNPAVIFKDFFFDEKRKQGMVHVLVAEDYLSQHVWIKILKTAHKGWCLAVADGSLVIPTPGAAKALEMVYDSAKRG